jgi:CRP/FNR family cyclic AMP-dependent transcriptional regulator
MSGGTTFDIEVIAAGGAAVFTYPDGTVIFHRGDSGDCAFIVKAGWIEIREKGRAVETIQTGEIFGEMALIDKEPRTASAIAVGDVELIRIDRPIFDALIRDDTDFALTIMQLIVRRLRAAMNMLERYADETAA